MVRVDLDEKKLAELREAVRPYLKPKRYSHTLAVEEEAAYLGSIFLPEEVNALRASALLHDITKKDELEKQLHYCSEFGIIYDIADLGSPKIFHAKTGAALAARDFPEYTDEVILSGVRWHTTGRPGMTLFESLIYLADYVEKTRTFGDCVTLRRYLYGGLSDPSVDRTEHFFRTMVMSFDMTIRQLLEEGSPIDRDTVGARNGFIAALKERSEAKE